MESKFSPYMLGIEVGDGEHDEREHDENWLVASSSGFYPRDIRDRGTGIDTIKVTRKFLGIPGSVVFPIRSLGNLFEKGFIDIVLQRLSLLIVEAYLLVARRVSIGKLSSRRTTDTYRVDGNMFFHGFFEGYTRINPNIGSPIGHEDDRVRIGEA